MSTLVAKDRKYIQNYRNLHPRIHWLVANLLIVLCLASQFVMTLQGTATFDSDEAIFGLMARHMLHGESPIYFYGQSYLGSVEAALAATSIWVFGDTMVGLRLSTLFLFAIFLVLHYKLVAQWWNTNVALLSLLFLALPSPLVRMWTHRPITGLAIIFVLGTALLLLHLQHGYRRPYATVAGAGVLIGLGLWSHPMISVYLVTLTLSFVLSSPEWAALYQLVQRRWLIAFVPPVAVVLGVVAVFSGGCQIIQQMPVLTTIARAALALGGLLGGLLLVWASRRRKALFVGALSFTGGFAVGNAPQWYAWRFLATPPDQPVAPSCLTDAPDRVTLVATHFIPSIWGLAPFETISTKSLPAQMIWWFAIMFSVLALVYWVWAQRSALAKLVTLAPLHTHERAVLTITILWALPFILAVLSGNTLDGQSLRYVLLAWPSGTIILALLLTRAGTRSIILSVSLLVFWIGSIGLPNVLNRTAGLPAYRGSYTPETVAAVEDFLRQRGVNAGYADYWLAYTITFVSNERLIIAPFNGEQRYPAYTDYVARQPVQAYILPKGALPVKLKRSYFKRTFLAQQGKWDIAPHVIGSVRNGTVLERKTIGDVVVWLVQP